MTTVRTLVPIALLALTLSGCPFHNWHWWQHHDHDGEEEPMTCETSVECDDGKAETLDVCTSDSVCDNRMVSYVSDVQPIFQATCAGCHVDSGTGMCAGGTCLASSYASLDRAATSASCAGLSVAECAQVRIQDGTMPRGRGCTGDPVVDAANASCLTGEQHAVLAAWLSAGWPE
jgi:hypothetical protein